MLIPFCLARDAMNPLVVSCRHLPYTLTHLHLRDTNVFRQLLIIWYANSGMEEIDGTLLRVRAEEDVGI